MHEQSKGLSPTEFEAVLTRILNAPRGEDYCINGLQLDADKPITKVLGAVTISDMVIDKAIEIGAQAIVVHHGWHWKGEDARVIGSRGAMTRKLLTNGISLFAFHQPLDQSPTCGNNIALAAHLGLKPQRDASGQLKTVCNGSVLLCKVIEQTTSCTAKMVAAQFTQEILALPDAGQNQTVINLINGSRLVKHVAICTGGGQRLFHDILRLPKHLRPDLFITGEISLPQFYAATDSGVAFLAGGHHNTEIFGIKTLINSLGHTALMESITLELGSGVTTLSAEFFNDWCPV